MEGLEYGGRFVGGVRVVRWGTRGGTPDAVGRGDGRVGRGWWGGGAGTGV